MNLIQWITAGVLALLGVGAIGLGLSVAPSGIGDVPVRVAMAAKVRRWPPFDTTTLKQARPAAAEPGKPAEPPPARTEVAAAAPAATPAATPAQVAAATPEPAAPSPPPAPTATPAPAATPVLAATPPPRAAAPPAPVPGVKPRATPRPAAEPAGSGTLNLRASDTADVYVDGKKQGQSPVEGLVVKAGGHKVRFDCYNAEGVAAPGATQVVTVVADGEKTVDFSCPE